MPKATHYDAIARLIEVMKHLPSKGVGVTAREITDRLEKEGHKVSKRTVERDLIELSRHFPLTCNDKAYPYGWRWMQGDGPDLPSLTLAEALSLTIVEDLLRPLLPGSILEALASRFGQAHRKLKDPGEKNPKARWAEKVRYVAPALPLIPPKIAAGVLETVQDALLADRQLQVSYKRPDAEEAQDLRLHPLGLVQRGPIPYLIATVFDYMDIRILAVHRIQTAQETPEAARRPEGFSLDGYINHGALHFGAGDSMEFTATVSDSLAVILEKHRFPTIRNLRKPGKGFNSRPR